MLARLSQGQLSRLVLPLGDMTKRAVREMARDLGFESVADRPDSQDICFAPRGHRDLLSLKGVRFEPGPILLDGVKVGEHTGLADYTIGQRKGIGVAGPEPYYVIAKIPEGNVLVIAPERESRVERVIVRDVRWQAVRALDGIMNAMVKLRYRSKACPCIIEEFENDRVLVRLSSPQPATAPGQHAVFYRESTVLGGGVIEEVG